MFEFWTSIALKFHDRWSKKLQWNLKQRKICHHFRRTNLNGEKGNDKIIPLNFFGFVIFGGFHGFGRFRLLEFASGLTSSNRSGFVLDLVEGIFTTWNNSKKGIQNCQAQKCLKKWKTKNSRFSNHCPIGSWSYSSIDIMELTVFAVCQCLIDCLVFRLGHSVDKEEETAAAFTIVDAILEKRFNDVKQGTSTRWFNLRLKQE